MAVYTYNDVRKVLRKEVKGMEAHEFLLKHSQEWSKRYPGKCIAIVGDKLVAIGRDRIEVYQKAKKKYPKEEISISYIPTPEETVTLLGT